MNNIGCMSRERVLTLTSGKNEWDLILTDLGPNKADVCTVVCMQSMKKGESMAGWKESHGTDSQKHGRGDSAHERDSGREWSTDDAMRNKSDAMLAFGFELPNHARWLP